MKRLSRRTTIFLVAGFLLVPAFFLSLLGVKLVRDFAGISGEMRADYGQYMSRIAMSAVQDRLWDSEQLNMVAARLEPPEVSEIESFLGRYRSRLPIYESAFFVLHPSPLVIFEGRDGSSEPQPLPPWLYSSVLETFATSGNTPSGLRHVADPNSQYPTQVTYFTVHSEEGRLLGAAGFFWNLDLLKERRSFFDRTLVRELRANKDVFPGGFLRSPVAITLFDETGTPFYSTADSAEDDFIAVRPFERILPFYRVGVHLTDDTFGAWVQNVIRTHLATIAVMFLAIVLAVLFSLRFFLHEMELAELKSTLVSNVSHELKTPLSLIRMFSETLEMGRAGNPEKEKEFLRIIHRESERLTHLINNVLDVGRIEQGQKAYRIRDTDLGNVLQETLDAYGLRLEQQGFTLEANLGADLPLVPVDPDAVTQAILNLLDNAMKYSHQDKTLRVDLQAQNGAAVISVEDRGIGITPKEQVKIFDTFYRVEKGLVHDVKGSGLGLALVRHIVEAHGGRVTVDSRPGRGSRFSLHFPLRSPGDGGEAPGNGEGVAT